MGIFEDRAVSAHQAVALIGENNRIFVHGAAATPHRLLDALAGRTDLSLVTAYHLHLSGDSPFGDSETLKWLHSISLFTGANMRHAIACGQADYMPVFLSDIPYLFQSETIALDVALVQLSPPDENGNCTLGTSIDVARAAVDSAKIVIAEINQRMPTTSGETMVRLEDIDAYTLVDDPLVDHKNNDESQVESVIGELIAELVDDRATLQMGIGAIPDAVLARLKHKHDLGVHTEMFSDRLVDLVNCGAVTNRYKRIHPNSTVTSFVTGTSKVFDFVRNNRAVKFLPSDQTNDPALIRQNDRVVAINSALQIDLTGQVCADSLGHKIYSGIGGQLDFMRGAALSRGGKPIIALPSTAADGKVSRIVSELSGGAGVVTTRGHVHWVVTEYGAVNLQALALRERAAALISIAHPDFRAELQREVARLRHF